MSVRAGGAGRGASPRWIPTRREAVRIAGTYCAFGALWILVSGWALHSIVADRAVLVVLEGLKGWLFVAVTAFLLAAALDRHFRAIRRSAELLQDSNERFRLLSDAIREAVLLLEPEGLIVAANASCAARFGADASALVGTRVFDRMPPEAVAVRRAWLDEVVRTGKELVVTDEHEGRILRHQLHPIVDPQGCVARVMVFSKDVTERHRTERRLRENEQQFRAIFQMAAIGLAETDPSTGHYLRVNPKMCSITGYSEEEMLARTLQEITHPEDRQRDWDGFCATVRGETPTCHSEKRYIRKDGKIAWVSINMTVIRDAGGAPLRALGSIEDISERIRAEAFRQALLTLGARLNKTRDPIGAGRALLDTADWLWSWDAATLSLVATGQDEPRPVLRGERVDGERREVLLREDPAVAPVRGRPEGEAATAPAASVMSAPILREGRVIGELRIEARAPGAYRDDDRLTLHALAEYCGGALDRIRSEAELRQSQKLEAVGQLAGGVAHDFNNVLASIMMHAALLQTEESADESIRQAGVDIETEAKRAAALTQQLLMFSRRSVLHMRPLNLNQVIDNLLRMLRRIIGEHFELGFEGAPSLPAIEADCTMMEQVVMNLVVNARDAMPRGGSITIRTDLAHVDRPELERRPNGFVRLTVTDHGSGMDAPTAKRAFEPFFTTKQTGTGLGLATVHGIVAQHRGWVEVESEVGRGSTFGVFLPPIDAADRANPARPETSLPRGPETILVVEDDAPLRRVVARALRSLGYRVYEASNGPEALRIWQAQGASVDLVFTDMVMPEGMSGFDLAERLRAERPSLKVLVSTGYSSEMLESGGAARPGVAYLPKPFEVYALAAAVREFLDRPA